MKKLLKLAVVALGIALIATGCSAKGNSEKAKELYIFNSKSEIGQSLEGLAKDYEEETGIKVKTFSPGSGADTTEAMNAEMTSKNPPSIFASNSLLVWGPKEGDFMYNLNETSNDELKKLADQVPDNLKLSVDDDTNFGIPYTLEGYGYIVDTNVLAELFDLTDTSAIVSDLKVSTYDEFSQFIEGVNGFITANEGGTVVLNGNSYQLAADKKELSKELTGVFVEAGAEKWTYADHMINVAMNTVYSSYSDALYSEPEKADELKDSLIKYIEVLEYNTRFTAGEEGPLKRSPEYINSTTGSYDNSLQLFAEHKGLFIKQGNWIFPNLKKINEDILADLVIIPIKMPITQSDLKVKDWTVEEFNSTIPTFVPNYWIINKQASDAQIKLAEDFITWLYTSERGLTFLKDESGFILYNDTDATDSKNTLNNSIISYMSEGKTLSNPFNASRGNFLEFVGNEIKENYLTKEEWDPATYPEFADKVIAKWKELQQDSQ